MRWVMATLLAVAGPALAAKAMPGLQSTRAHDLEVMADLLSQKERFGQMIRGACRVTYRRRLTTNPDDIAMEKAIPGIHERMIAAMSAYCDAEIDGVVSRLHARVMADWSTKVSAADLARLAGLYAPLVEAYRNHPIEYREGDLAADAAGRSDLTPQESARIEAAETAFARTAHDAALLKQVNDYMLQVQAMVTDRNGEFVQVIQGGLRAGRRAANAYAREKGLGNVYRDE